jgi:hypothetical protein
VISYQHLGSIFFICSPILHTHLNYISERLLYMGTSRSFHPSIIYDKRILLEEFFCIKSSLHFLSHCSNPPNLCFSLIGKWYTHNWSCFEHVTFFFAITKILYNIRTFNAINKVCSLVSTRVKPIYITSSKFSYIWIWSSYSKCSNGFFGICGILHIKGAPKGPQHNC